MWFKVKGVLKKTKHIISQIMTITIVVSLGMAMSLTLDSGLVLIEDKDVTGVYYVILGIVIGLVIYKICMRYIYKTIGHNEKKKKVNRNSRFK